MTAAALVQRGAPRTGLQRADPARDMAGIAKVVQIAFAGQLDIASQRMLRDMRRLGGLGWLGSLVARLLLPSGASTDGYVYLEDGEVVGNASVLPVEGELNRWVIANVAVHPDSRRRGVARAMVQAAIELARRRQGETVILQVDRANAGARELYQGLGFRVTSTRTTWVRPSGLPSIPVAALPGVRPRRPEEWQAQWELAARVLPDGFFWPYPPEVRTFRQGGMPAAVGMSWDRHWVWQVDGRLRASLTAQTRVMAGYRFLLVVEPAYHGQAERALLTRALRDLPQGAGGMLEFPAGVAEGALWELGFRPDRTLTWMALDLAEPRGT